MKRSKAIRTALLSLLVTINVLGCAKSKTRGESPNVLATSSGQMTDGNSNGGGGFLDEPAKYLLKIAQKELSQEIEHASPEIFAKLPKGSQARMVTALSNLRTEFDRPRSRYGRDLVFDYGFEKSGSPYLIATRGFTMKAAGIPLRAMSKSEIRKQVTDLKVLMMHEVAHVLGIGKSEELDELARAFAYVMIVALSEDNFICSLDLADIPPTFQLSEVIKRIGLFPSHSGHNYVNDVNPEIIDKFYLVTNRPSGKSVLLPLFRSIIETQAFSAETGGNTIKWANQKIPGFAMSTYPYDYSDFLQSEFVVSDPFPWLAGHWGNVKTGLIALTREDWEPLVSAEATKNKYKMESTFSLINGIDINKEKSNGTFILKSLLHTFEIPRVSSEEMIGKLGYEYSTQEAKARLLSGANENALEQTRFDGNTLTSFQDFKRQLVDYARIDFNLVGEPMKVKGEVDFKCKTSQGRNKQIDELMKDLGDNRPGIASHPEVMDYLKERISELSGI